MRIHVEGLRRLMCATRRGRVSLVAILCPSPPRLAAKSEIFAVGRVTLPTDCCSGLQMLSISDMISSYNSTDASAMT